MDLVELTDEESSDSDDEDEVAKIFRIETNVFNFKTPLCRAFKEFNYLLQIDPDVLTKDIDGFKTYKEYKDGWIYEWNKDVPWVHERPWTKNGVWKEPTPVKHHWNLPGAYIIGNTLRYQDLEWYEALKDGKLKEEALKNKAIMDGMIDEDDEPSNEGWKIWDDFDNTNRDNEERPRCKEIDNVGEVSTIWKSRSVGVLKSQDGCSTHILAHKLNLENLPNKISGEFLILILLIPFLMFYLYNEEIDTT
ncbi:hypothetical protein Tco_1147970 [Tanacetum coccineum]